MAMHDHNACCHMNSIGAPFPFPNPPRHTLHREQDDTPISGHGRCNGFSHYGTGQRFLQHFSTTANFLLAPSGDDTCATLRFCHVLRTEPLVIPLRLLTRGSLPLSSFWCLVELLHLHTKCFKVRHRYILEVRPEDRTKSDKRRSRIGLRARRGYEG